MKVSYQFIISFLLIAVGVAIGFVIFATPEKTIPVYHNGDMPDAYLLKVAPNNGHQNYRVYFYSSILVDENGKDSILKSLDYLKGLKPTPINIETHGGNSPAIISADSSVNIQY